MARADRLAEAHVLKLNRLEHEARNLIDDAWAELSANVSTTQIATVFEALDLVAKEAIGIKGQAAIDESARYAEQLLGFEPAAPTLGDLGDTVEDFLDEIDEHVRHVQNLIRIRSRRMARQGMSPDLLTEVIRQDFEHGGQLFGFLKNSIKRSVASAVNQIGKEAEHAAFRGRRAA